MRGEVGSSARTARMGQPSRVGQVSMGQRVVAIVMAYIFMVHVVMVYTVMAYMRQRVVARSSRWC